MSDELVQPELFGGIPYLVFSRLRPAHVLGMIFGFLATSFYGGLVLPGAAPVPDAAADQPGGEPGDLVLEHRHSGRPIALMNGDTHSHEYAEYPWYVAWALEILLAVNASIIYGTIAARREPKLYVSLWYIGGTVVWIILLVAIGFVIWHPFTTYQTLDGQSHIIWTAWGATPHCPPTLTRRRFNGRGP